MSTSSNMSIPTLLEQFWLEHIRRAALLSESQQTDSAILGSNNSTSGSNNPPGNSEDTDRRGLLSPSPSPLSQRRPRSDSFEEQEEVKCLKTVANDICAELGLEAGTLVKFADVRHKGRTFRMLLN